MCFSTPTSICIKNSVIGLDPPEIFTEKVERGELGVKTGKGFYQYTPESVESLIRRRDEYLVKPLKELRKSGSS